ncbi:hypothetical protein [Aliidiomarina indica]|uniref:hypothetical protein n=1 Tax=Aliidiomarina indica TaxID=2749147 RepID=UPI00188EC9B2|nr:hypothetical protein [Aliidiomarina indica]
MRMLLSALVAVLLMGCTSAGSYSSNSRYVVDWEKVDRIESAARAQGVEVVWVQVPMKRVNKVDPKQDEDNGAQ